MQLLKRSTLALLSLSLLGTAACSSSKEEKKDEIKVTPENERFANEFNGAPEWVLNSRSSENPKSICGVGSVGGTRNISLAKTAAEARARTAIANVLGAQMQQVLKQYQSTTTGGAQFAKAADDEQRIVDTQQQITNRSLTGAQPQKTWVSPNGNLYSLVCLDAEAFKTQVNAMEQLDAAVRKYVVDNAENAFADLDAKLGNRKAEPPSPE